MSKIIAVDFDGTLCENRWPEIGEPNMPVIRRLRRAKVLGGAKVILWTCRTGLELWRALDWCDSHLGFELDAVNENLPELVEAYGGDCRKIYADEYWDDQSVRVSYEEEFRGLERN